MLFFRTRGEARLFATIRDEYRVVDRKGNENVNGLRWAVKVLS